MLNYVMFMLISNEPIKVAHLQKLANQLMLNGPLVIEMINNSSFSKSMKNVGRLVKRHCAKNHIFQVLEYHGKLKKTKEISSFHQLFGWKKDRISHHRKVQNKNFSVTSKYHLSINFLTQKKTDFPSLKSSIQELFSNQ